MATRTVLTADDLLKLPRSGQRYELVKGELVRMTPPGFEHGEIVANIARILGNFVVTRKSGSVVTEAGFLLGRDPDTVRAPDVAFVSRERLAKPRPKGYFDGAPDVAVEVISPNDTYLDVHGRIEEWLGAGSKSVWIVEPGRQRVTVYTALDRPRVFERDQTVADPQLPGLDVAAADFFAVE
ncbi:Uma2 family endonuclease [Caldinitratiruptor microaerophilus]|uniref:Putative restriction endonuclease domain-containing protein n=1 Tax=Caldinitratiruptor microaerophilus TaxID=671077 RepID=A0AA35CJW9_9FIRM|nr:Uma2 family endonuclease [Caldinitratiruptor microaerophilus]BDG60472.1 hypothetical protein caldi_15620 [Caldinitratiruptor microaerophilus]